jgi:phage shock protein PspC (stress-responsive transcriptional regulator)
MNKVTTINLNGNAFQLEEDGYEALRAYLERAARNLEGNPDKDEIIADIEQAIADKFRAMLGANKTVVVTKEVEDVVAGMGPVQDASDPSGEASSAASGAGGPGGRGPGPAMGAPGDGGPVRRLYRIREGAMVAGVCNGLAAYLNVDVSIVRILFVVLTVIWGFGVLLYILMMFVVPAANTPAEKTAAFGVPSTAEEFIRRAKEGYYQGLKAIKDNTENRWKRREWKRRFRQERRAWKFNMERRAWNMAFRRAEYQDPNKCGQNWGPCWGKSPHADFGVWFFLSLMEVINVLIALVGFYAVYSLVVHGGVFGMRLPAGIPLWAGVIGLIVLFNILTGPVRVLRRAYFCRGVFGAGSAALWEGFLVLAFIAILLWMPSNFMAQIHEALRNAAPALHHALDTVRRSFGVH